MWLTYNGNSAFNVVKEMADYEGLAMLLKKIGKMPVTAAGWCPIIFLEGEGSVVFVYTALRKVGGNLETQKVHSIFFC